MSLRSVQFRNGMKKPHEGQIPASKENHMRSSFEMWFTYDPSHLEMREASPHRLLLSEDTDMTPFPSAAWQTGWSPSIYFMKASLATCSFDL